MNSTFPEMRPNIFTLLICIPLLVVSCSQQKNEFFIRVDNAGGISDGARVEMRGVTIGQVDKIFFDQHNKVILRIAIDHAITPATDAAFMIRKPLGTNDVFLDVVPGTSSSFIQSGDTIAGVYEDPRLLRDSLGNSIKEIFIHPDKSAKQDSMLDQLKKLNENIEQLRKERE